MATEFDIIQNLLQEKADYQARLNLLPFDGSPEVKEKGNGKYLYVRKRIGSRLTSTYVDVYSDDLYQLLLRNAKEARDLNKQIRRVDRELIKNGYIKAELPPAVLNNLDFARANMKANIYDQAILEGVATTFPQTAEIIENGTVHGMTANDVQKILNLKHAWEFILDEDVIQAESNFYLLSHIARLINEGFFQNGGRLRGIPVTIGGTQYAPPLPIESVVIEKIHEIVQSDKPVVDRAIELCMYCMRTQAFLDGNKRAAIIFANHFMIGHGAGLLIIPEKDVTEFKQYLVKYYESADIKEIGNFLKEKCWKRL
ncbi:Fic family protein [uncultured Anaerovibrio sp.]|uniref:Fic family protein n=1 Tax=uncultured Anaerovibrio sp. TaxID=361586 RepID=UPI0025DB0ADC|nr:Fic family protein [uncultured Anaerovibrio sp.]